MHQLALRTGAYKFLLTPLREGRLGLYRWDEKAESISTHAPAGGATCLVVEKVCNGQISTHAPAGGATRRL